MNKIVAAFKALLAGFLLLMLFGCEKSLSPQEVTHQFWAAVEAKDSDRVRRYVATQSFNDDQLTDDILPISEFKLGRIIIDQDTAEIDTTVVVQSDQSVEIPLKTLLLKQGEDWKVDYRSTVASVKTGGDLSDFLGELRKFSGIFKSELNNSLDQLERAMPQIKEEFKSLERQFKSELPELEKRLQEFARELEDSMKEPRNRPPAPNQPRTI